ncbi:hypothetical protein [Streptomyces sp. NPDC029003]|uniref:hypothetical protein n=1 Tax=Streptomyces sp. NPDC029003 TaxID=3155125 RepID=UPI0033E88307
MRRRRLLVTGPSGTGTTTLGRSLASRWAVPHADVDDYLWLPTSPPYTHKRPVGERLALMEALFVPRDAWVLSGSLRGWGDGVIARVDAVVYLSLEGDRRMDRLMRREVVRYGDTIARGGRLESAHRDFLDWARGWDESTVTSRSRDVDDRWLAERPCPVLRLDSSAPVSRMAAAVDAWFETGTGPDGGSGRGGDGNGNGNGESKGTGNGDGGAA